MATEGGFLGAVKDYLTDAAGGKEQKQRTYDAAKAVDKAPGPEGEALRFSFTAWLHAGRWLAPVFPEEHTLEPVSRLHESRVADNYTLTDRFTIVAATTIATAAYKKRVETCARELRGGRVDAICHVYATDEWLEARSKAGLV